MDEQYDSDNDSDRGQLISVPKDVRTFFPDGKVLKPTERWLGKGVLVKIGPPFVAKDERSQDELMVKILRGDGLENHFVVVKELGYLNSKRR